jgi:integrase
LGGKFSMAGLIKARGKCPDGGKWSTSKNGEPITCDCGRNHVPKSYFIEIKWLVKSRRLYYDAAGERLDSMQRAARCLNNIRAEIDAHTWSHEIHLKDKSGTVATWWERWEGQYKAKQSTRDKLRSIRMNNLGPLADHQIKKVRSFHLTEWWDWLDQKGHAPSYRNDILEWVKSFFKWCWGQEIIQAAPRSYPTPDTVIPQPIEYYNENQQLKLIEHLPEHDRPIFRFTQMTGCRVMEAAALRHADLDRTKKIITFRNTFDRHGQLGPVKNRKTRRWPLMPDIENILPKITGLDYVFLNQWGRHYSYEYLRSTFKTAQKDARLPEIDMKNASRHSLGMRLTEAGVPSWDISKMLGHSDTRVTDYYRELLTDRMAEILSQENK